MSFKHEKQKVFIQHLFSLWLNKCTITHLEGEGGLLGINGRLALAAGRQTNGAGESVAVAGPVIVHGPDGLGGPGGGKSGGSGGDHFE